MIYFDTSYLARCYLFDPGWQPVRQLAGTDRVACAEHGQVEFLAAVHRKLREGSLSPTDQQAIMAQFDLDQQTNVVQWLALTPQVFDHAARSFRNLPPSVFLRSSDALHLACAAENGFADIYSNDRHLLAAAVHFGLTGVDII